MLFVRNVLARHCLHLSDSIFLFHLLGLVICGFVDLFFGFLFFGCVDLFFGFIDLLFGFVDLLILFFKNQSLVFDLSILVEIKADRHPPEPDLTRPVAFGGLRRV